MAAEAAHEIGRDGVMRVKQFLESTTYLNVPWTAYDHENMCKLQRLDGSKKVYDLRGYFLGERRRPLYIESKKYANAGSQGVLYREFLADVYSIVARAKREDMDEEAEFMWVTWHPFSLGQWSQLAHHEYVRSAVAAHPEVLDAGPDANVEESIDDDLCRVVGDRLWMIVLSDRQYDLVMSPRDIKIALASLNREGA
jgi:hypothetical protein